MSSRAPSSATAAAVVAGMTDVERYDFDRLGYIIVRNFLTSSETEQLRGAVDRLEAHARARLPDGAAQLEVAPPIKHGPNGGVYLLHSIDNKSAILATRLTVIR